MTLRIAVAALILVSACTFIRANDKKDDKKEMVVVAGQSTQEVRNHPYSRTTPGHANTTCSGDGTIRATANDGGLGTTDIHGTVDTSENCNTTYTPPTTVTRNRITVNNASWVTDVATGDQYLIQCTAGWELSKCSYLNDGRYKAALKGNNMWITGAKGMKQTTAKYHVLQYVPSLVQADKPWEAAKPSTAAVSGAMTHEKPIPSTQSPSLNADESYAWQKYRNSSPEDKDYVQVFCNANPKGAALLPRAKVTTGQGAEHALDCSAWISAKSKESN